jgi:hypothetical protein
MRSYLVARLPNRMYRLDRSYPLVRKALDSAYASVRGGEIERLVGQTFGPGVSAEHVEKPHWRDWQRLWRR